MPRFHLVLVGVLAASASAQDPDALRAQADALRAQADALRDQAAAVERQAAALDQQAEALSGTAPGRLETLLERAESALRQGDAREALQHAQLALEEDPRAAPAHLLRAHASRLLGQLDDALHHAQAAVELDPTSADAWGLLGGLHTESGAPEQGLQDLRRALSIAPDHPIHSTNYARILLQLRRLDEAAAATERLLSVHPEHQDAWLLCAQIARLRGRFGHALRCLDELGHVSPGPAEWWVLRVELLLQASQAERALQQLDACRGTPLEERPQFHTLMAHASMATGRIHQAREAAQQALRQQPDAPELHGLLHEIARRLNDTDAALRHAEALAEVAPDQPRTWVALARARAEAGDMEGALDAFTQGTRRFPAEAGLHLERGVLLRQLGRAEQAIASFERFLELAEPSDPNRSVVERLLNEHRNRSH